MKTIILRLLKVLLVSILALLILLLLAHGIGASVHDDAV